MMVPTIHRNGTGREALLEQQTNAGAAIRKALEALAQAAPNGRDFYPQGDGAYSKASAEHAARMEKLRSVLTEVGDLAEAIADAE
jgi:hypothetical protein